MSKRFERKTEKQIRVILCVSFFPAEVVGGRDVGQRPEALNFSLTKDRNSSAPAFPVSEESRLVAEAIEARLSRSPDMENIPERIEGDPDAPPAQNRSCPTRLCALHFGNFAMISTASVSFSRHRCLEFRWNSGFCAVSNNYIVQ